MAVYFAEKEDNQRLDKILDGISPVELQTPIHIGNDHGIEIIQCRSCKTKLRDRDCAEISRTYSVYQCPKCKAFFKNP